MEKQSIYKKDSKGKDRIWTIWVEGNPYSATAPATLRIENGIIGGANKQEDPIVYTEGKNLGKKNATTPYTQAVSDAKNKMKLKLRKEYVENLADAKSNTLSTGIQEPMTAKKYDPTGNQNDSKTLEKFKLKGKNIAVQPKIDGNRNMSMLSEDGVRFYTRTGGVFPHIPHVELQLKEAFDKSGLSPLMVDGELHSKIYPFRVFNGALNSKTIGEKETEIISTINYWLYDVYSDEGYEERYEILKKLLESGDYPNLILIPSKKIVATDENLLTELEEYLEEGYEGAMLRRLGMGYEHKRTDQLIKYKVFEDEEFEILDLLPDAMGRLGKFLVKLNEPVVDRDGKILTTVKVGLGGVTHSEGKEMLAKKADYIGKWATVEFFGRDPRPRFPKFKAIREEKI